MSVKKNQYSLNIGPIHPALKEPIMFNLDLEGERVVGADIVAGHNHRGIEYMGMQRNPVQIIYLAERICGICSISHTFAYCMAVENAYKDIEVPVRAHYIRTIMGELERIHSHLLWAGVGAHEMGFDTYLHKTWEVRERCMDTLEYLCGNRVNYGILGIGGVRRDIDEKRMKYMKDTVDYYRKVVPVIEKAIMTDKTFRMRCEGVGILTKDDALKLSAVGPTARASGVKKDHRVSQPHAAYGDLDIDYVIEYEGDMWAKTKVRLRELYQSIDIIDQCLKQMPDATGDASKDILWEPKMTKLLNFLKKNEGEGQARYEAPRGEAFHYVKCTEGSENVTFWKARAPTYNNVMTYIPMLTHGIELADVPIVVASIDPCIGCMDRVTVKDSETGEGQAYSKADLLVKSKKKTAAYRQKLSAREVS